MQNYTNPFIFQELLTLLHGVRTWSPTARRRSKMKQKSRIGKRRHFSGNDISITHAISQTLFHCSYAMRIASSRALNGALPRSIRFNIRFNILLN